MSWILAFLGFAALIVLHEAGHFAAAKAVGMRVERFSLFFPLPLKGGRMFYLFRKRRGETEYAIGPLPLGGFVRISGMNPSEDLPDEVRTRAYTAQPVWKRIVVIAAGPLVNLVLAALLLFVFFWQIGPEDGTNRVADVNPALPAAGVIQPGDRLLAVDGKRGSPAELSKVVASHTCAQKPPRDGCRATTPAKLLIERGGRERTIELTPVFDAGVRPPKPRLGFTYDTVHVPQPAGEALGTSLTQFWFITKETVKLPARLFDAEKRKEISGVVGSYEVTRQTIIDDLGRVVGILAIISLSLAIINLFPFLPLDGGHIFWALVEKVRGKAVPYSVMERAGVVGFMLVMVLFAIGLTNDIGRLTGEGFNVR